MPTFTDPRGTVWEIALTAGDLGRVKRALDLDLREALKPGGGKFTDVLDDTGGRFMELLWLLVGRTATIPRDEFADLFDRDTTVAAVAAVWESIWLFFRGPKVAAEARAALLAAADQVEGAVVSVMQRATELVQSGRTSSGFVNSSPESSASTTDLSPSAS